MMVWRKMYDRWRYQASGGHDVRCLLQRLNINRKQDSGLSIETLKDEMGFNPSASPDSMAQMTSGQLSTSKSRLFSLPRYVMIEVRRPLPISNSTSQITQADKSHSTSTPTLQTSKSGYKPLY